MIQTNILIKRYFKPHALENKLNKYHKDKNYPLYLIAGYVHEEERCCEILRYYFEVRVARKELKRWPILVLTSLVLYLMMLLYLTNQAVIVFGFVLNDILLLIGLVCVIMVVISKYRFLDDLCFFVCLYMLYQDQTIETQEIIYEEYRDIMN